MEDVVPEVRRMLAEAFHRGLAAVDPRAAVRAELESSPIEDQVTLVAMGKAAPAMAQGAIDILGTRVVAGVVVSHGPPLTIDPTDPDPIGTGGSRWQWFEGGHPVPTQASLLAGRAVMAAAASATGTLLVLVSGGASSLAEVPVEGLALADVATTYRLLLRSGLPIEKLNTVRRHLSSLKNGGLLSKTRATTVTLLMADVAGADASVIASGPTLPDSSLPADALSIVTESGVLESLPAAVVNALRAPPRAPESSPPHRWAIVIDGLGAVRAASTYLRTCGFKTQVDLSPLVGDAAEQGRRMAKAAVASTVTVRHGETVVKVQGEIPGGRNQHAALSAAVALDGQVSVFAALATDGRDGLTDAAGAIVDGQTCNRMRASGLDPQDMLAGYRSHEALEASADLVVCGPTGTNVSDLWMSWRQDP